MKPSRADGLTFWSAHAGPSGLSAWNLVGKMYPLCRWLVGGSPCNIGSIADRKPPHAPQILSTFSTVPRRGRTVGRRCLFAVTRELVIRSRVGTLIASKPTPTNAQDPAPVHAMAVKYNRHPTCQKPSAAELELPHQHADVKKASTMYTLYNLDGSNDYVEEKYITLLSRFWPGPQGLIAYPAQLRRQSDRSGRPHVLETRERMSAPHPIIIIMRRSSCRASQLRSQRSCGHPTSTTHRDLTLTLQDHPDLSLHLRSFWVLRKSGPGF